MQRISLKLREALKHSLKDGVAYSAMIGFGEHYFLAYAILMSATDLQLALVATLPILIASIVQLGSVNLMHKMQSRKKSTVLFVAFQALMFIPLILIYSLASNPISSLIFFVTLYWVFGLLITPIWTSWMGDLVPRGLRGNYFSKRYLATSVAVFISFLIGGFVLNYAEKTLGDAFVGFAILFVLAMISRLFSVYHLIRQDEPPFQEMKEYEFSLKDFLKEFPERFKKGYFNTLVLYLSLMSFGIYFIAPYIVAFMLNDLQFSYLQYVVAMAVYLIIQVTIYPIWGFLSDKYGSVSIIKLTGILMSITPILWMFPTNLAHIILIQIFAGFVTSGFLLGSFNLLLENTTSEKRITAVSYYHLVNGVFIFLGSITAALILKPISALNLSAIPFIGQIFWTDYILIFFISGLFRIFVSLKIAPKLKEIKRHRKISSKSLAIRVISEIPSRGLHLNLNAHRV